MLENVLGDNFTNTMKLFRDTLFTQFNCVSIAKVESVNFVEQTITAQIVYKRVLANNKIKSYPLLLDVPFFILQGGGSYLGLPIKKGDYCILLFCDRNFSIWWDSGNETEPESERKHSLSDGIALVGLNPKSNSLGYSGEGIKGFLDGETNIESTGDISLTTRGKINIANNEQSILSILVGLIDIIKTLSTYGSPTTHLLDEASKQNLENYKKEITKLFMEGE